MRVATSLAAVRQREPIAGRELTGLDPLAVAPMSECQLGRCLLALGRCDEIDRLFSEVISYYINPEKCQACMVCLRKCPVEAITGGKSRIHVIDQEKCLKCGTCFEACPPRFGAIEKITGEPAPPPIPEGDRIVVRKNKKQHASLQ